MKKAFILAALMASVVAGRAVSISVETETIGTMFFNMRVTLADSDPETTSVTWKLHAAPTSQADGEQRFSVPFSWTHESASWKGGIAPGVNWIFADVYVDGVFSERLSDSFTAPSHLPDGGATAALLGLGVAGLAFARRKLT
jgi:hypothetical protein